MIELMVSLVILAMVSSAFSYGLQMSLAVTRDDRARIQAANLAARELEIARNQFGASKKSPIEMAAINRAINRNPFSGPPLDHDGPALDLDGTRFTVTRTVQWLPGGTGTSPCDGGAAVTYPSLGVNVNVTWTDNGRSRDVESNTVLTPPKGTLATAQSFVAAKVQGANGTGVASLPVDISGPGGSQTRVTAHDGCAVFALSATGNYTVTLDEPGFVSFDGQPTTSKLAVVGTGTIQVVPFSYDEAATLELDFVVSDDPGAQFAFPSPKPAAVLFNPSLPTMGNMKIPIGQTTVTGLWPFPDGYSVWGGTCDLNDPAKVGGTRPPPLKPEPGETLAASVELKPVRLTFVDAVTDVPIVDEPATATITNTGGCEQTSFNLGTTDENGVVKAALPYGQWSVTAGPGEILVDVVADGSVSYPLELPKVGG